MYFLGLDIGGTAVKGGIVKADGTVLCRGEVPTEAANGAEHVLKTCANFAASLCAQAGISLKELTSAGAGIPGIMDTCKGVVTYNNNLGWRKVRVSEFFLKRCGIKMHISNDANVAALGETVFGSAKGYSTSVFVTLGTGVGGGVIIDGKIFEGNKGAGAELGHMVIKSGGEKCTCGRKGCMEMYSSATALIHQTKKQMERFADSALWDACGGDIDKVNGKTAFDVYAHDKTAQKVIKYYTDMLAEGLANFANIFRPEIMILGGGISKQGTELTDILAKKLKKRIYGGKMGPPVELRIASLKNDAGFLGAAALAMQRSGIKPQA